MMLSRNIDRLRALEENLRRAVRGQEHVLPEVVQLAKIGELGLASPRRPKGSFLFIGPTGVGKTELARTLSRCLYDFDEPFAFDMSEFAAPDAIKNFIGDETGSLGRLGDTLARHSGGILLVDEIEKAHRFVHDVFLQILDAGRITCGTGRVFDLSDFYVIFTSNHGAADILRSKHLNFTQIEKYILAQVATHFRPEFLGRINAKLVFNKLSYGTQLEIARFNLEKESGFLAGRGHHILFDEGVLTFLIQKGFDKYLGARPLRDAMEKFIRAPIAEHLIEKEALTAHGAMSVHPSKSRLTFHPAEVENQALGRPFRGADCAS
jgi:ATP-dependent Clp protease ATP-binding subunit ClpA